MKEMPHTHSPIEIIIPSEIKSELLSSRPSCNKKGVPNALVMLMSTVTARPLVPGERRVEQRGDAALKVHAKLSSSRIRVSACHRQCLKTSVRTWFELGRS